MTGTTRAVPGIGATLMISPAFALLSFVEVYVFPAVFPGLNPPLFTASSLGLVKHLVCVCFFLPCANGVE